VLGLEGSEGRPEMHEMVTVYVASGQLEAEVVRGRLESEGIPAILRYESAGLVYGLTVNGLGKVEVQVPSILASLAQEVLADEYPLI
jgi:hypothetical protein